MNKEQAIKILRGDVLGTNEQTHEAVFMAIKALKTEQKHGRWIPCSERIPEEDEWVLGTVYTIHDGEDAPRIAVVKISKGISETERESLRNAGEDRARIYMGCDEFGNNKRPYCWETWGPMTYFGQEVIAWMPLPKRFMVESNDNEEDEQAKYL